MQVVFNPLSIFSSLLVPEGTLPFLSLLSCFVLNVDGKRSAPFVFLAERGRNEVCSFRVDIMSPCGDLSFLPRLIIPSCFLLSVDGLRSAPFV